MKKSLITFFIILVGIGCTSQKEKINRQKIRSGQIESEKQDLENEKQKSRNEYLNDSLSKTLLDRFPLAFKIDTFKFSFTYLFQECLEKSSNYIYSKEAEIMDFEKHNGMYLISINCWNPEIFVKLLVNSQLSSRILQELTPSDLGRRCCFIAKVNKLIPIQTEVAIRTEGFTSSSEDKEVSSDEISDHVSLNFSSNYYPSYFIEGELIDFYIIKQVSKYVK